MRHSRNSNSHLRKILLPGARLSILWFTSLPEAAAAPRRRCPSRASGRSALPNHRGEGQSANHNKNS
jgi:hypothetical protein